jgi:hypothetical protein
VELRILGRDLLIAVVRPEENYRMSRSYFPWSVHPAGSHGLGSWVPVLSRLIAYACPFIAALLVYFGLGLSRCLQVVMWVAMASLCVVAVYCRPSKVEGLAIV